ncbi:hypothetical protein BCR32DRAFT_285188 [Anaeromyces robustus]|uniref:Uncharacterized protein n=1 Tax=Anaeromyces robustus TaxID=1754192 RepID=A0A1Y1WPM1_9FUNG|nr:hypothetical protein BCR32DRAFT_285188 [Anaeromyces robustus]|eukprot:ORX75432.1 hypothetical protein BCR32DRAFT_285188 [Anaeromyces robustus]
MILYSRAHFLAKIRNVSNSSIISLREKGVTDENVRDFEKEIQRIINQLKKKSCIDDDGRIEDEIAIRPSYFRRIYYL